MVAHSLAATSLTANKWETKRLLEEHGFDIPPGVLVDSDVLAGRGLRIPAYVDSILIQTADMGYPVLSKPLWDCMGAGMVPLADEAQLERHLTEPHSGNFILERCVSGEICSVEVVGARGQYVVHPVVWQGPAETGPVFNFGRLRYVAPRREADLAFASVAEKLKKLARALDLHGAVGLDMIYEDGIYRILEINPGSLERPPLHSLHRLQHVRLPALHPGRDLAGRGGPRARSPAGVPAVPGARTLPGIRARCDPRTRCRTDAVAQYRRHRPSQCDHHLRARRPGGTPGEARIALAAPRIHRPVIPAADRGGRRSGRCGGGGDDRRGNGMTKTEVWEKEMKETAGSHAD